MKIVILKLKNEDSRIPSRGDKNKYRANVKELPGSPPVGLGKTKREAVADLFCKVVTSSDYVHQLQFLIKEINADNPMEIIDDNGN